jgi:hypothetical protein
LSALFHSVHPLFSRGCRWFAPPSSQRRWWQLRPVKAVGPPMHWTVGPCRGERDGHGHHHLHTASHGQQPAVTAKTLVQQHPIQPNLRIISAWLHKPMPLCCGTDTAAPVSSRNKTESAWTESSHPELDDTLHHPKLTFLLSYLPDPPRGFQPLDERYLIKKPDFRM